MNIDFKEGPIIACSSGRDRNNALAVLRISGFKNLKNQQSFFSIDLSKIKPRYAHLTKLLDANESLVDEIVLTFFPAPKSFTGENILELSVHGNLLNIDKILNLFTKDQKIRLAQPGEFSYRALKNSKLNLSEIEGLDVLLNATNELALQSGLSVLHGEISKIYSDLRQVYLKMRASIEILIDFSEDVGEEDSLKQFNDEFDNFYKIVDKLSSYLDLNVQTIQTPDVSLLGFINAGKSTLFNNLIARERSIVSNIAGTTRDYISEKVSINNNQYNLIDTAGVRQTNDPIELEGIKRAKKIYGDSFFKCLVVNIKEIIKLKDEFSEELKNADLIVLSHCDEQNYSIPDWLLTYPLLISGSIGPISASGSIGPDINLKSGSIGPDKNTKSGSIEPGEILNSGSIGPDRSLFWTQVERKWLERAKKPSIPIKRHQVLLSQLVENTTMLKEVRSRFDIGVISSEINLIGPILDELIGIVHTDEVLNDIFENFCIGK